MKIAIIGAGAMGGAVATGLWPLDQEVEIAVSNPSPGPLEKFRDKGYFLTSDNAEAVRGADVVILAVKPWIIESVIKELKPVLDYSRQAVAAIVAGVSGEQLCEWFEKDSQLPQMMIVMPNTAMAVGASMTFIAPVHASAEAVGTVERIFNRLGSTMVIDEAHLPAATALASCGIAYAMRYVRAASEGGVELGFKASQAQQIVLETLKGAVELLQVPGAHPESEIDKVTTPGGLTIRGLNEMEHAGFTSAVIRGLKACVKAV